MTRQFITDIHSMNESGMKKVLSDRAVVRVNRSRMSGGEAADIIGRQVRKAVRGAQRYEVRMGECEVICLEEPWYQVVCSFRLVLYVADYLSEQSMEMCIVFRNEKIISIQMFQGEAATRRHSIVTKNEVIFRRESQIRVLESRRNYLLWHCEDGVHQEKAALCHRSKLLSDRFVQVRSSHWVNMDYIARIKWHELSVLSEDPIQIPRARYRELKEKILEWNRLDLLSSAQGHGIGWGGDAAM